MRSVVIICLILILTFIACQKKTVPVITERKTDPPAKIGSIYPPAGTVAPDTAEGRAVFIERCGRCHGLPDPVQFNAVRWESILELMIPRARIDKEIAVHVRAYVLANAAK